MRCPWSEGNALLKAYHDTEWGVPVHDDRKHFEFLVLDAFQAGLSWATILNRREGFREAFAGFDPEMVARFDQDRAAELMQDTAIIRNRLKIEATITNARHFLRLQQEHGSFDAYIWQFTGGNTIMNAWEKQSDIPASTPESDAMSKALKKEGFKFAGTTICYAYMQAAGMVHDHITSCWRYGVME